jgi:hypothetical protein
MGAVARAMTCSGFDLEATFVESGSGVAWVDGTRTPGPLDPSSPLPGSWLCSFSGE